MNRTDIINYLIKTYGHKSYLEIGVYNTSINFDKVQAVKKIGVDPAPVAPGNPNIKQMTSDHFFQVNTQTFDIIFIDGLHHAEQVIKDINNSLSALAPNGTIVVHDCNPTTEVMQRVPRETGVWTGDVWKAWLHFRQNVHLSMTVLDTDFGVGVIRRGWQCTVMATGITWDEFSENKEHLLNLKPVEVDPISICIPAFEQYGHGGRTLNTLLKSIQQQDIKECQIIVSDNATDNSIKEVCMKYPVKYVRNKVRGISANTNNALDHAKHPLVKIMYQDDAFIISDALQRIAFALKFNQWVACSGYKINDKGEYIRAISPRYTNDILQGKNYIGMPSVVGHIQTEFRFDEKLKVLLDAEFYWQQQRFFGEPGYIRTPVIGSRYWEGSTSHQQDNSKFLAEEVEYLKQKYNLVHA